MNRKQVIRPQAAVMASSMNVWEGVVVDISQKSDFAFGKIWSASGFATCQAEKVNSIGNS